MKRKININLFYIPAIVIMLIFVAYPLAEACRISFTQWNGYSQYYRYIGFGNFLRIFQDTNLGIAFKNTLFYGFISTLFQNILGLSFAVFLNSKFKGHTLVRTIIYLPIMISNLIMGYIMYFFVQYNGGVLNEIIGWFGFEPVNFMANGNTAVLIITLINIWQYTGISMIIYMAGLQNIPEAYYEAATIDGAGSWNKFRHITLPLLVPSMSSSVILNLIGGLKLFDVIVSLTGGGPGFLTHSLSSYISNQYFKAQNAGYSAAVGLITFFFILIVSNVFMRIFKEKEVEF